MSRRTSAANVDVVLDKGPTFVWGSGKKAKPDTMARSLRALAMVMKVGESEARALEIVGDQFKKFDVGRAYTRAAVRMRKEGATFRQAVLAEEVFPRTVHELVQASATTASLHHNLVQASKLIQQGQDIKKKLLIAMIQPGFMLGMCLIFIFVAAAWIIPGFVGVFASLDQETPFLMTLVMNIAEVTKWVMGGLLVLIALIAAFWALFGRKMAVLRRLMDTVAIRMPKVGPIVQMAATSRLFELLYTNLKSGMSEPDALRGAGAGCGNEALMYHCDHFAESMRSQGTPMSKFAETSLLPTNAQYMLGAAPSVKQQIEIMTEMAPEYRKEADTELEAFTRTIEPMMTYLVYGVAGGLILAIVTPMYSMFPALMEYGA